MIARIKRFLASPERLDQAQKAITDIQNRQDGFTDRLNKLDGLFHPADGKKVTIKQFIDKETDEIVSQEIHETRSKRK